MVNSGLWSWSTPSLRNTLPISYTRSSPPTMSRLRYKLRSYSQEQVAVQSVVVRDERVRHGPRRDGHQHRRLHLQEPAPVHEAPDRRHDARPQRGGVTRLLVCDQVQVALPVARLHVHQPVPLLRQRPQRLAQHPEGPRLHRDLAHARPEHLPAHADPVPQVQVLENAVVLLQHVAAKHHLDAPGAVEQVRERRPTHAPERDYATRDRYRLGARLAIVGLGLRGFEQRRRLGPRVRSLEPVRVGVDAPVSQPAQLRQANAHQFVIFQHSVSRALRVGCPTQCVNACTSQLILRCPTCKVKGRGGLSGLSQTTPQPCVRAALKRGNR